MKVEIHWNGDYGGGEKEIIDISKFQLENWDITKSDVGTRKFDDFMQQYTGMELYHFDYKIVKEKKKIKAKVYKPVKRKSTSYKVSKKKSSKRFSNNYGDKLKGVTVAVSKKGQYRLKWTKKSGWLDTTKAKANTMFFNKYKVREKVKYPKYTLYIF